MSVIVSLIVAHATNGVIGIENTLPWRLPADLKHFKSITMGKPILMGRKTFESIGKALPGRLNVVITRQNDWQADGPLVVTSIDDAIELAAEHAEELMIIGGEQIYRATLEKADRIYRTLVEADVTGDAFFPPVDDRWRVVEESAFPADSRNQYPYRFQLLERQ